MAKRGFQGAVMRGFGARDHTVTVTGRQLLAPHFLRIRMSSPTLFEDSPSAPTSWVRFWFPDPDGTDVEHQRAYTLNDVDESAGTFAIDVVLHHPAGPATTWAERAEPGAQLSATSMGSSKFELPDELPAGYLVIGDPASIPAINGILATVPAEVPIELYLEQHEDDDLQIPLTRHPRVTTHWVPRRGAASLAEAIAVRDWSDWYAWAAPETGTLKHLRSRLRDEFGFPKAELYAQAYWSNGRQMGSLRAMRPVDDTPADPAPSAPTQAESPSTTTAAASSETAAISSETAAIPSETAATSSETTASPSEGVPSAARGAWRSQAAGRLLAPLRGVLILAGVLQAVITLIELAPFVLLVELARLLLTGAGASALWTIGLWAVGLMGGGALLAAGLMWWLHTVDARFSRALRQRLLAKLARLPLGWFDARTSGQVSQLVQDDTLALHYLTTHAVPDAVAAVVAPVGVLVYLFAVDWRIALLLLLPVLVYVVTMSAMVVQSGGKIAQASRWATRMNSEAAGYLDGQPVVRVFGGATASTFRRRLGEYIAFLNDWQRPFIRQRTIMDLATRPATALLLIVLLGAVLVGAGSMDPVSLLPFLLLGTTFGSRLLGIGYGLSGLRGGLLAARRLQLALDEPELRSPTASTDRPQQNVATGAAGQRVEFAGIGFSYRPGVPVLDDIDLTLEPGTVTALVGPSGSGKSTLAGLLARFHDVAAGEIRIDGDDIAELSAEELYARVGFVFQRTQLIRGTVGENIALAVPDADQARIESAARAAQIHDRILRMPDGYDTVLGPDAALSGGERQRLTIARAILADTPVLVLDEATAYADPESEYLVQQALNRLTAGRTVLVIAHRLRTITGVDRIVVLEGGRVVETGTHTELLARGGRYHRLWCTDGHHDQIAPDQTGHDQTGHDQTGHDQFGSDHEPGTAPTTVGGEVG